MADEPIIIQPGMPASPDSGLGGPAGGPPPVAPMGGPAPTTTPAPLNEVPGAPAPAGPTPEPTPAPEPSPTTPAPDVGQGGGTPPPTGGQV